jgi:hypothetical protein
MQPVIRNTILAITVPFTGSSAGLAQTAGLQAELRSSAATDARQ